MDHSHTRGRDHMNPFLIDNWAQLDPGYFIVQKDQHDE